MQFVRLFNVFIEFWDRECEIEWKEKIKGRERERNWDRKNGFNIIFLNRDNFVLMD